MKNKAILNAIDGGWNFDNSYLNLPELFYVKQNPIPVHNPQLVILNDSLAQSLGLDNALLREKGTPFFSGNKVPEGAEPIAQAYAGHQFGYFTMLGDGRAILLGEQITPDGDRFDIQLKGSGRTNYSRNGDGRAALGPMLREYIISEAMAALGIPTTRSLAVVTTGEEVRRETALPGAVLTRIAASHIRVGTFEYALARGEFEALQALADYTIQRHYPQLLQTDNPYLALLQTVMERQAQLIAKWQQVGFIHGVMNTDNMAISGETIDYGPCAFMDIYASNTVFSSIDRQGRYAYGNQPLIAQWNLARFSETLMPFLHPDETQALALAEKAISNFPEIYRHQWLTVMRAKLGLLTEESDDIFLIETLLSWMYQNKKDYTNTFRTLSSDALAEEPFFTEPAFMDWHSKWQARLIRQDRPAEDARRLMRHHNPAVIPRNHYVEEALASASKGELSIMHNLLAVLAKPYDDLEDQNVKYSLPPEPSGVAYKTFCGT